MQTQIAPVDCEAAWTAAEMRATTRWTHEVTAEEKAELARALEAVRKKSLRIPFGAAEFPLDAMARRLALVRKEVEDGTMRMTLCRPVSRIRVLIVKFLASLLYCLVLVVFIGGTALLTGWLWRGLGSLCAIIPEDRLLALFPPGEGLVRYFSVLPFFALSLCSIVSLAFMFSCCNMKPAAATVVTMTVFLVDRILYFWPQFVSYKPWFMTTHMVTWVNLFRSPVPWAKMGEDYLYLLGLNATFFIVGCTIFLRRDLKS